MLTLWTYGRSKYKNQHTKHYNMLHFNNRSQSTQCLSILTFGFKQKNVRTYGMSYIFLNVKLYGKPILNILM